MSDRFKRILMIISFVLVTIGIAYVIYRVFFKTTTVLTPALPSPQSTGQLPSSKTGAPTAVQPSPLAEGLPSSAALAPSGTIPPTGAPTLPRTLVLRSELTQSISANPTGTGIRSYNAEDGKFYRVMDDGTAIPLSNQSFYNVDHVTWGKSTDQAVIRFPDGSKVLYDFRNQKQVTLPKQWEDFDFSPQDDHVVAKSLGNNEDNRFLIVAKPDGTQAKIVESLGNNQDKVQVSWSPNNQVIAFSGTGEPLGYDRQQLLLIGQNHENFKGLVVEGRGFTPNWSPSGQNLLYSTYQTENGYRPMLWLSGASGDNVNANRHSIGLQTWADKCAWQNEQTVVCAVPRELGEGAGFQRQAFANVPDSIVRVNVETGTVTNLGQPDGNPSIDHMVLSSDGQYAYYNDAVTGRLVRFAL